MPTKHLTQEIIERRKQRYAADAAILYECWSCHVAKPVSEFYFDKQRSTGHSGNCKLCEKTKLAEYRKTHPEKARAHNARRTRKKDGTPRKAALFAVMYAIKCGALKRPEACSVCGEITAVEAHHPNGWDSIQHLFLDIQWVCRSCHMDIHSSDWHEWAKLGAQKNKQNP